MFAQLQSLCSILPFCYFPTEISPGLFFPIMRMASGLLSGYTTVTFLSCQMAHIFMKPFLPSFFLSNTAITIPLSHFKSPVSAMSSDSFPNIHFSYYVLRLPTTVFHNVPSQCFCFSFTIIFQNSPFPHPAINSYFPIFSNFSLLKIQYLQILLLRGKHTLLSCLTNHR